MHVLNPWRQCPAARAMPGTARLQRSSGEGQIVSQRRSAVPHRPPRSSGSSAAATASHGAAAWAEDAASGVRPGSPAAAVLAQFEGLDGAGSRQLRDFCEVAYLSGRSTTITDHFPGALGESRAPPPAGVCHACASPAVPAWCLPRAPSSPSSPAHAGIDDFLHRMEIALFAYGEGVLHGLRGLPMPLNQLWTARRQAAAAGLPRRS